MNLLTLLLKPLILLLPKKKEDPLYGLDHAILNIPLPPATMWMNMGYWEQETTLPAASRALLDQVLITAGLFDKHANPTGKKIRLLDVGFGCGDQTLYLLSAASGGLVAEYVGVTIVLSQVEFASRRLANMEDEDAGTESKPRQRQRARLFHADAAKPSSWAADLKQAVSSDYASSSSTATDRRLPHDRMRPEPWVLALDTLYHFRPSRRAFVEYVCSDMQASMMAFDLVLSDSASVWNRLLLMAICWVSGTPFANFLTRAEYEAMLVEAGYSRERIEWRDISGHVFGGIARFIKRRDEELKRFGMGVGKFRVAEYVFDWWASSGVIRGVVVVARR